MENRIGTITPPEFRLEVIENHRQMEDREALFRRFGFDIAPEIAPGVCATGPIPRSVSSEDAGGAFFCDATCQMADPLTDDQSVFIRTTLGLVVVLGCAHAGVINTLNWIDHLQPGVPVQALLGGTHLGQASPERLAYTLDALRGKSISRLHPDHCTGWRAHAALAAAFPDSNTPSAVGMQWEFDCL
jgi:7,8-dihydropterin-6-yl-methyl-4-(beta-D-ribofuranosyl)aminobenzene 5'-phosphate synthase